MWTYFGMVFPLEEHLFQRDFLRASNFGELSREFDQSLPGDGITHLHEDIAMGKDSLSHTSRFFWNWWDWQRFE
jgi:hypothetical protein